MNLDAAVESVRVNPNVYNLGVMSTEWGRAITAEGRGKGRDLEDDGESGRVAG